MELVQTYSSQKTLPIQTYLSEEELMDIRLSGIVSREIEKNTEKEIKRDILIVYWTLIIFIITVVVGTIGYRYLFDLSWIDAFYAATLILTAISEETTPVTVGQKLFVIFYAIFAVIVFLSMATNAVAKVLDIIAKS